MTAELYRPEVTTSQTEISKGLIKKKERKKDGIRRRDGLDTEAREPGGRLSRRIACVMSTVRAILEFAPTEITSQHLLPSSELMYYVYLTLRDHKYLRPCPPLHVMRWVFSQAAQSQQIRLWPPALPLFCQFTHPAMIFEPPRLN
jgi:hypothetical protein